MANKARVEELKKKLVERTEDEDIEEFEEEEEVEEIEVQEDVKEGPVYDRDPKSDIKARPIPDQPTVLDSTIAKQVTQMGKATAEKLRKQKQYRVQIPVSELNKHDQECVVGVNGWNFQIKKGVPVTLPETVVKGLQKGGYNPTFLLE